MWASAGWCGIAALVLASSAAFPAVASESAPLTGSLSPATARADIGGLLKFKLELSAWVSFDRVGVHMQVPEGMSLLAGKVDTELTRLAPGESRMLEYQLRVDQAGTKEIRVEAKVLGIAPSVISETYTSVVNPADIPREPPTIRRDPDGKTYQTQGISIKKSP